MLTRFENWARLPNINPAYYHAAGLALSILYLYLHRPGLKALIVAVVLIFDWLDGATARRHKRISRAGYLTDVLTDRASEAFIFAADSASITGQVFFGLWMLNTLLVFYSVRSGRHLSLPLRFVYMLILLVQSLP